MEKDIHVEGAIDCLDSAVKITNMKKPNGTSKRKYFKEYFLFLYEIKFI